MTVVKIAWGRQFDFSTLFMGRIIGVLTAISQKYFWDNFIFCITLPAHATEAQKIVQGKKASKIISFATKMVTLFSLDKECILLLTYLWDIIAITAVIKMFMSIIDWLILGWLHYYRLHSKKNLG